MQKLILAAAALMAAGVAVVPAAAQTESRNVSFEDCLQVIRKTAAENGTEPHEVVNDETMRMVRIPTADGSLLMTCNRASRRLTITKSERSCGIGLKC